MEFVDIALFVTYGLLLVGVLAVIVLPLISAISNPKSLVQTGIGLAALLIIFGIAWAIAGDEVTVKYGNFGIDAGLSKFIGGILTMMYIVALMAVAGIIATEISRILR